MPRRAGSRRSDRRDNGRMARAIYTAEATVTGGRGAGHGTTSDGQLDLQLRLPTEMGGSADDPGTNPEQLFAIGYAACFEGALSVVGRRFDKNTDDASIRSSVSMSPNGAGGFELGVDLAVTLPQVADVEEAKQIVAQAHEVCPYSNATRGNIEVTLSANGEAV
jgi:lipoyl-dependent peroxiredoxin